MLHHWYNWISFTEYPPIRCLPPDAIHPIPCRRRPARNKENDPATLFTGERWWLIKMFGSSILSRFASKIRFMTQLLALHRHLKSPSLCRSSLCACRRSILQAERRPDSDAVISALSLEVLSLQLEREREKGASTRVSNSVRTLFRSEDVWVLAWVRDLARPNEIRCERRVRKSSFT